MPSEDVWQAPVACFADGKDKGSPWENKESETGREVGRAPATADAESSEESPGESGPSLLTLHHRAASSSRSHGSDVVRVQLSEAAIDMNR